MDKERIYEVTYLPISERIEGDDIGLPEGVLKSINESLLEYYDKYYFERAEDLNYFRMTLEKMCEDNGYKKPELKITIVDRVESMIIFPDKAPEFHKSNFPPLNKN